MSSITSKCTRACRRNGSAIGPWPLVTILAVTRLVHPTSNSERLKTSALRLINATACLRCSAVRQFVNYWLNVRVIIAVRSSRRMRPVIFGMNGCTLNLRIIYVTHQLIIASINTDRFICWRVIILALGLHSHVLFGIPQEATESNEQGAATPNARPRFND